MSHTGIAATKERKPSGYNHDPELGWVPSPDLSATFFGPDFSVRIDTDERGFRLGAGGVVDNTDPVVVLVGDSYSFGWGVSGHETFASYLDERLSGIAADSIRLVNLGVGGYGTLASAARLRRFVAHDTSLSDRLRGILIMHSHNDMSDNVLYSLFRSGFREPAAESATNPRHFNSAFHLVNLTRYVLPRHGEA